MADYDSDSSGLSDHGGYTETGVLLGYASKEPIDDIISHLGGHPTWLDQTSKPPATYVQCKVCQSYMTLLLELNGDLPEHFPNTERRLYIFSCRKKTCSRKVGTVRALREVRKSKEDRSAGKQRPRSKEKAAEFPSQQHNFGAALFGSSKTSPTPVSDSANPFSISSVNGTPQPANPFAPLPPTSTLAALPPQAPDEDDPPSNPFSPLPPTSSLAALPPQAPTEVESEPSSKRQPDLPETFAYKLRVSSSQSPTTNATSQNQSVTSEPWPSETNFPTPYPHLYIDADYETLSPSASSNPSKDPGLTSTTSKIQYEEETDSEPSSSSNKDTFESSLDSTFLRFSDRLAQNPEQVLRYEWKGTPILYSGTDAVASRFPSLTHQHADTTFKISTATASTSANKITRCEACGAERAFELQLVPGLISVLEEDEMDLDAGMEWGTVLLAVCTRNCSDDAIGKVSWREEWCGVQWEERVIRK